MKKSKSKIRIVLDTNVWISGLISNGKCRQILKLFADNLVEVIVSEEGLSELRRKITQKFPPYLVKLGILEVSIREDAEFVPLGRLTIRVSSDPDDDKFIEMAVLGRCDYIVSGDNDLLTLGSYEGIQIIKPADFLAALQS